MCRERGIPSPPGSTLPEACGCSAEMATTQTERWAISTTCGNSIPAPAAERRLNWRGRGRMSRSNPRREFLAGIGATAIAGLSGCAPAIRRPQSSQLELPPLRLAPDRISAITVCTRPFRAQGPRLEAQRLADKTVIHHYGHGGSGWSLSWGMGYEAMQLALATGERDIGVIGCGAIGLTTAVLLARTGARVTIYAKDLPPFTRSSWATGVFTPDSRIALAENVTPEFARSWNERARYSYRMYQSLLGLADRPVEYLDAYSVDGGQDGPGVDDTSKGRPAFAQL